jgi:membrane protein
VKRFLRGLRTLGAIVRDAGASWQADNVPRLSAALAFYALFSLAPAIFAALAIASLVLGNAVAQTQLRSELEFFAGPIVASAIEELMAASLHTAAGASVTLLGIVLLCFGGSGIFLELRDSLDAILGTRTMRRAGLMRLIKIRTLAFLMVLAGSVVLLAGMIASTAIQGVLKDLSGAIPVNGLFAGALDVVVLLFISAALFVLLYRQLPRPKPAWHAAWVGAWVAAILFVSGELAVSLYLGRAAPASPFGAAGAIFALLIWVYYSAQIVYFGAELTKCYTLKLGSRAKSPSL